MLYCYEFLVYCINFLKCVEIFELLKYKYLDLNIYIVS